MPTTALTIGPVHTLLQNEVYALPARACWIQGNVALETSNLAAFTTVEAVAADVPVLVSAAFVRATVGDAIVRLVAA